MTASAPASASAPAREGYHHGDLEQALVDAALAQVRERGGEAVSLRQVAQAVGVSPSAAYTHFPDKSALMVAVGGRGMLELDARMVAATGSVPGTDDLAAVERFRATGEAYVRFATQEPHLFRHVFGPVCALGPHKAAEEREASSVSYGVLCAGLDDLERRGLLRPGAREGLDVMVWTMIHGFASLVLDGFLPVEAGDALIDTLARATLSDHARSLLPDVDVAND